MGKSTYIHEINLQKDLKVNPGSVKFLQLSFLWFLLERNWERSGLYGGNMKTKL